MIEITEKAATPEDTRAYRLGVAIEIIRGLLRDPDAWMRQHAEVFVASENARSEKVMADIRKSL